jgi:hypothetical protein
MRRRWVVLAAPLLTSAAMSAVLVAAGWNGWKGAPNPCVDRDGCYCERWRPGPVRQPANTWSCLAFVAAGLLCAGHAYRRLGADDRRMLSRPLYPALFASGLALIGPASMALHASMTDWGGKVDGSSMDFFIAFCAAFGLRRRFGWGARGFWAVLVLGTVVPIALKFIPGLIRGELVFAILVTVFGLNELLPEGKTRLPRAPWLASAAALFFAAFAVWLGSVGSTGPLCAPDSLLQGHAVWHVLSAAAAAALYGHLLQERLAGPPSRAPGPFDPVREPEIRLS